LWDVSTHSEVRTLKGHIGGVSGIAFSPDGTALNFPGFWGLASGFLGSGHGPAAC
jgi:WD40 repeat protein